MVRVLHLADRLSTFGGADHYLLDLIAALRDAGVDQRVGAGRVDSGVAIDGVTVSPRRLLGEAVARERGLEALVAMFDWADHIVCHNVMNPVALRAVAETDRGVVVVQDHRVFCPGRGKETEAGEVCRVAMSGEACAPCFRDRAYGERLLGLTEARLDAIRPMRRVVLSTYMAAELARVGCPGATLIPPAVAVGEASQAGSGFMLAGRLVTHKGMEQGVAAWRKSGVSSRLRVAGRGPLDEALGEVERVGWLARSALHVCLAESRALLFPSRWQEPFGIVGVEALAVGTPVIVMDGGGVRDWAQEGTILVPRGDVSAMSEAIGRLEDAPDHAVALGRAGRDWVARTFTQARFIRAWCDMLCVEGG